MATSAAHVTIEEECVIPGIKLTIVSAITVLDGLCREVENETRSCSVFERLQALWTELLIKTQGGGDGERKESEVHLAQQVLPAYVKVLKRSLQLLKVYGRKPPFARLAACRRVAEALQELHCAMDELFKRLNPAAHAYNNEVSSLALREQQWGEEERRQSAFMELLIQDAVENIISSSKMSSRSLLAALMELKYEIETQEAVNTPEHLKLMRWVLESIVSVTTLRAPPVVPKWFIPSYEVECPSECFAKGSYTLAHCGTLGRRATSVVVKHLHVVHNQVEQSFVQEIERWSQLSHPHVIKLYGGNHLAIPMFLVCEDATNGNFVDHFQDQSSNEKPRRDLWRLFYQVALGLEYLHSLSIEHSNVRCASLLIGADGLAKLSDSRLSVIRAREMKGYHTVVASSVRWTALDRMESSDSNEIDTLQLKKLKLGADVYALGMCIIEAVTGDAPWGATVEDSTILNSLLEGVGHPRPEGLFSDEQWELVSGLGQIHVSDRIKLSTAIEKLKELADEEERGQ